MNTDIKDKKEKIKKEFFTSSSEAISDKELLENVLTVAFSSDKAEKITASLFEKYSTLGNILNADAQSLLKIDEINEKTAVFISMLHPMMQRIMTERNKAISNLSAISSRKEYGANLLRGRKLESPAIICLDKNMDIISCRIIGEGAANFSQVNPVQLVKAVMYDQPEFVIIMHNHPSGGSSPSLQDFNFTVNAKEIFNSVGFKLIDHIIIGADDEYSMSESAGKYFTD